MEVTTIGIDIAKRIFQIHEHCLKTVDKVSEGFKIIIYR